MQSVVGLKKQDCRRCFFGRCPFGDRCRYKHDPKKQGTGKGNSQNHTGTHQDLIVFRPVQIDIDKLKDLSWNRQQSQVDVVLVVNFDQLDLTAGEQPPRGYDFFSDLSPLKLPAMEIRVIRDSGAEGPTLSQRAASRLLRAQGQLAEADKVALINPKNFKAQHFYGFAESAKDVGGVQVDGRMSLNLVAPCGTRCPELDVRIVKGQLGDLLIIAPNLDYLAWNHTPTSFFLASTPAADAFRSVLTRGASNRWGV